MSEHRLDEADVGAVLQHQRRHRVAEEVTGAGACRSRRPAHRSPASAESRLGLKALAEVGQEQRLRPGCSAQLGPYVRRGTARSRRAPARRSAPCGPSTLPWRMSSVPRSRSTSLESSSLQLPAGACRWQYSVSSTAPVPEPDLARARSTARAHASTLGDGQHLPAAGAGRGAAARARPPGCRGSGLLSHEIAAEPRHWPSGPCDLAAERAAFGPRGCGRSRDVAR